MVVVGDNVTPEMADMCYDAQTSGGLLIAVAKDNADKFLKTLHNQGVIDAAIIGHIRGKGTGRVYIRTNQSRAIPSATQEKDTDEPVASPAIRKEAEVACCEKSEPEPESSCCSDADKSASGKGNGDFGTSVTKQRFQEFMQSVNTPGGLDAYTKQAVNIALSVVTKCGPCLRIQVEKAKKMGFSQAEIEEAAWMGIAFGGASAMMFYKVCMQE
jgi:AhpD family alkylhydroperoxidase